MKEELEETDALSELVNRMKQTIVSTVPKTQTIGVAFSGGVDSCLVAKLLWDLGFDVVLLSVGFKDSHDLKFSCHVASLLNTKHKTLEIGESEFLISADKIKKRIPYDDGSSLSLIENAIAFTFVCKLANSIGITKVVTANGIDELFCGYDSYRRAIPYGTREVHTMMDYKLDNEHKMFETICAMVQQDYGVELIQPFLQDDFVKYAKTIPVSKKIINSEDLLRKHIIRQAAKKIDAPAISVLKRKKALQYGTMIHKSLVKSQKSKNKNNAGINAAFSAVP